MKATSRLSAAGLALIMLPAPVVAAGITYDCDTAANHFSELVLPASGTFIVSGNVQLLTLAGSKTYVPIARVQIAASAAPGQAPSAYAGFSLSALPTDPRKTPSGASAIQMLSYNVAGKDDEGIPLSVMAKPGTVEPFALAFDGNKVSVSLGNDSKSFPLAVTDPVVRIVCSTGEFLFTNVTISLAQ